MKIWIPAILILMLIITAKTRAQDHAEFEVSNRIRGGIILGMNASQIDGDDYAGFHKVGFNAGFYGQLPVSKRFFISTEILYSQEGANNPVNPSTPVQDYFKWNLQYAQIPVLIHFQDKKAISVSQRTGAKKTYFTHLSHQMGLHDAVSAELPPGIFLAYDGLTF
jgi:hypothetical protein